jgi:hypothetical protein
MFIGGIAFRSVRCEVTHAEDVGDEHHGADDHSYSFRTRARIKKVTTIHGAPFGLHWGVGWAGFEPTYLQIFAGVLPLNYE